MDTNDYRLKYVLVGVSGSGKSTMGKILEEEFGFRRCITSTTRPPRAGEIDGKDYYFRSQLDPTEMFECASFGGHEYGITKDELARGDFVILEPQGVQYYRKHYPAPLTVIQLQREGIQVDEARRARDTAAGFDDVHPDYIVIGETIADMSANLLKLIYQLQKENSCYMEQPKNPTNLDSLIKAALAQQAEQLHIPPEASRPPRLPNSKENKEPER